MNVQLEISQPPHYMWNVSVCVYFTHHINIVTEYSRVGPGSCDRTVAVNGRNTLENQLHFFKIFFFFTYSFYLGPDMSVHGFLGISKVGEKQCAEERKSE